VEDRVTSFVIGTAAAALGLSCRPQTEDDGPFIERLYRSTREEEMEAAGWPEAFRGTFAAQQNFAQNLQFEHNHPGAERLVVLREGAPVGRLYLGEKGAAIWLIDISLLPEARGRGLGAALIGSLQGQGRPVGLSVFATNPARRLYERLGFAATDDSGAYVRMEWTPPAAT
jgi:GNAT superfamily N-acetyltransferase